MIDRRFSIAPMLDWTDRHARYFFRLFSRNVLLYTEMVTSGAVLFGDRGRFLAHHPHEHPVAFQLGGSDPGELARSARYAADAGFDEINLNIGCPSDRVQSGRFGACLMAQPDLVARCVDAMARAVSIAVTVKTRIGIDRQDSYEFFARFVDTVADAGCRSFTIHARKAWLQGLSPKQNREIPPLVYDTVYRLKRDRPELEIVVNGGIRDIDEALRHLECVDGVMMGREAFRNPAVLFDVDRRIFGSRAAPLDRETILRRYLDYADAELRRGTFLKHLTPPLLGLFQGQPGAKAWKRHISENAHRPGAGLDVLRDAAGSAFDLDLAA
ncbi:MAG: tRNA dihydrouridine(20/20a) synthase DusA [Proteobacteria bacterium]|nr:MAG: tRNA dihydrouridine(20/20a) synthase DusA [Pseudomonadota bacterium]